MIFRHLPMIATMGGAVGGYITMVHKHLFGARTNKRNLSYYQENAPAFDAGTQQIIDGLTDHFLLKLPVRHMANVEFYWSNQPTPTHHGAIGIRHGAYIGIPISFRYKSIADINTSSVIITKSAARDSPQMQQLLDSLVLSENAKKFAIASELHSANTHHLAFKGSFLLMVLFSYTIAYNSRHFLKRRSAVLQTAYIFAMVACWTAIYINFIGVYDSYRQKAADKDTVEMGQEYLDGGIEYVSKLIQRNLATRELEDKVGPLLYDARGNGIQGMLEVPVLSLTDRLAHLQTLQNTDGEEDRETESEA